MAHAAHLKLKIKDYILNMKKWKLEIHDVSNIVFKKKLKLVKSKRHKSKKRKSKKHNKKIPSKIKKKSKELYGHNWQVPELLEGAKNTLKGAPIPTDFKTHNDFMKAYKILENKSKKSKSKKRKKK